MSWPHGVCGGAGGDERHALEHCLTLHAHYALRLLETVQWLLVLDWLDVLEDALNTWVVLQLHQMI